MGIAAGFFSDPNGFVEAVPAVAGVDAADVAVGFCSELEPDACPSPWTLLAGRINNARATSAPTTAVATIQILFVGLDIGWVLVQPGNGSGQGWDVFWGNMEGLLCSFCGG